MPLIDLSLVTESLIRLLTKYIAYIEREHEALVGNFIVTGDPPDLLDDAIQLSNAGNGVSLYLFSVEEDGYNKNLPSPSGNTPPVRFTEMGLSLFYLLTAKSILQDPTQRPFVMEQLLMGYAIKAFHDFPSIDAKTSIESGASGVHDPDSFVFPDSLRSNARDDVFRLSLHPAQLDELNKVWTGLSSPMRLSAMYQVSVVLLEAEEPVAYPVPVLIPNIEVGLHLIPTLWIQSTESEYRVTLPGEPEGRLIKGTPASVPVDGVFRILGSGLTGEGTQILLQSPFWSDPSYVDITGWMTSPEAQSDRRLELSVDGTVGGRTIVPGPYQLYLQKGGELSNFCPIMIAPLVSIDPLTGPAETRIAISGGPFSGDDIRSVEVVVGSIRLIRRTQTEPHATEPESGEFIIDGDDGSEPINAAIPSTLQAGFYPIRVVVNGVSSLLTCWFEVTLP